MLNKTYRIVWTDIAERDFFKNIDYLLENYGKASVFILSY